MHRLGSCFIEDLDFTDRVHYFIHSYITLDSFSYMNKELHLMKFRHTVDFHRSGDFSGLSTLEGKYCVKMNRKQLVI